MTFKVDGSYPYDTHKVTKICNLPDDYMHWSDFVDYMDDNFGLDEDDLQSFLNKGYSLILFINYHY